MLQHLQVLNASADYIVLFLRLHKYYCFLFQQGGPCELEVTGQNVLVVVNGADIIPGTKVPLRGGDEVMFGRGAKHAYVSLLIIIKFGTIQVCLIHLSFLHIFDC